MTGDQTVTGYAVPDAAQTRAFWLQRARHAGAARRYAAHLRDLAGQAVAEIDRRQIPSAEVSGLAGRYESELAALEALREFGAAMGITSYTGPVEQRLRP